MKVPTLLREAGSITLDLTFTLTDEYRARWTVERSKEFESLTQGMVRLLQNSGATRHLAPMFTSLVDVYDYEADNVLEFKIERVDVFLEGTRAMTVIEFSVDTGIGDVPEYLIDDAIETIWGEASPFHGGIAAVQFADYGTLTAAGLLSDAEQILLTNSGQSLNIRIARID